MVKIFIDAGHGGTDAGACGNGLQEKNLTLRIAQKLRDRLLQYENVEVKMSREGDTFPSLQQRTDSANAWKADFFLSIHINSGGGEGFETYRYIKCSATSSTGQKQLVIHNSIQNQAQFPANRGTKSADFHVLRESNMEAVLTENGFIDNAHDAGLLAQDSFLDKIAYGHELAFVQIFGLKKKYVAPAPQPQPAPQLAPTPQPTPAPTGKVMYRVIAGSFGDKANAEAQVAKLQKAGFQAFIEAKQV